MFAPSLAPNELLILEAVVALAIFLVVSGSAFVMIKREHAAGELWRARAGAAITGAILGGLVGFAVLPLRFTLMEDGGGDLRVLLIAIAAFAGLIIFRRGGAARLPVIGPTVRAYRKAMLRRSIDAAQKQLEKLEARDAARVRGSREPMSD